MKTYKIFLIALMLFTGFSVYSFGETFMDLTYVGYHRLEESYLKAAYSRSTNGYPIAFSFKHYPNESSWGFGASLLVDFLISGQEFSGTIDVGKIRYPGTRLGLLLAPSYKFKLSEKLRIPLTFGPVFSLYFEDNSGYYDYYDDYVNANYEAFDIGVLVDASVIFTPFVKLDILYFRAGLSVEWDFFRSERGQMNTEFRHFVSARSSVVPYMSAGITLYFGIGFIMK